MYAFLTPCQFVRDNPIDLGTLECSLIDLNVSFSKDTFN